MKLNLPKNLLPFDTKTQHKIAVYCENPPKLLQHPLHKNEPIAFVASPTPIGDTLIGLVTVNNLIRNGYQVDVYSDHAYVMREWFPTLRIFQLPPLNEEKIFARYGTILHTHDRELNQALNKWHPHSIVLYHKSLYKLPIPLIDIHLILCQIQLGLTDTTRENGIKPLPGLIANRHAKRIIIHPTSSATHKNWTATKFVRLAQALQTKGYDPHFVLAPNEIATWEKIIAGKIPVLTSAHLSDVAVWLYESKYFIGNDSGIGHLASNLGLPTLSIVFCKSVVKQWRPTWGMGVIIMPPSWLQPRMLQKKFWQHFISVNAVLHKFEQLTADRKS
ncbi:MAG: hypothetical protein A2X78_00290 [Gammaproteobacteria bacterium GWE2_37_16]|nr:MAG: hypothetical protein A2X78_00290 [Gammaproteobacteria bacterium GWE2_37_16]